MSCAFRRGEKNIIHLPSYGAAWRPIRRVVDGRRIMAEISTAAAKGPLPPPRLSFLALTLDRLRGIQFVAWPGLVIGAH